MTADSYSIKIGLHPRKTGHRFLYLLKKYYSVKIHKKSVLLKYRQKILISELFNQSFIFRFGLKSKQFFNFINSCKRPLKSINYPKTNAHVYFPPSIYSVQIFTMFAKIYTDNIGATSGEGVLNFCRKIDVF